MELFTAFLPKTRVEKLNNLRFLKILTLFSKQDMKALCLMMYSSKQDLSKTLLDSAVCLHKAIHYIKN